MWPTIEEMLEDAFPGLSGTSYNVTSPYDPRYNCIAWAINNNSKWWWPDQQNQYYWPDGIPRELSLDAYVKLFESFDYEVCDGSDFEEAFEKVAIFIDNLGNPTHAARQLESGKWTSKLGPDVDIEHELESVSGSRYGRMGKILKRPSK